MGSQAISIIHPVASFRGTLAWFPIPAVPSGLRNAGLLLTPSLNTGIAFARSDFSDIAPSFTSFGPISLKLCWFSFHYPAGAIAAPLATSYKSTANITSVGPGNNNCYAGRVPVAISGTGTDPFGDYTLTEQLCANPLIGQFSGQFKIAHSAMGACSEAFNGTFVPSGQILEIHATWSITGGTGPFSTLTGAGTGKGSRV